MPTPHVLQTKAKHNEELAKVLALKLHDLLEEAALFEQKKATEEESKEPNLSLIAAENFIKTLSHKVEALSDSFELSVSSILNFDLKHLSILNSAIRHRFNTILTLLLEHGINLKAQGEEKLSKTSIAAEESNFQAFKTLYETPDVIAADSKEGEALLLVALDKDPRTIEIEMKDQEAIAHYLITEAKIDLNFKDPDKDYLYHAAVLAQSPFIVELILQRNPNNQYDKIIALMQCINNFRPGFEERIFQIVNSILNHFTFTQDELDKAILLATEMDCTTFSPKIIQALKTKGANLTPTTLNLAIEEHVKSIVAGRNANASLAKIGAIFKAGGKVNADPAIGSRILIHVGYYDWREGIVEFLKLMGEQATDFSHEQLLASLSECHTHCRNNELFKFCINGGIGLADEISVGHYGRKVLFLQIICEYRWRPNDAEFIQLCKEKIKLLSQKDKDQLLFKLLVDIRNKKNEHPFCSAMRLALVEAGADINQYSSDGRSLLFWAVYYREVDLVEAMCRLKLSPKVIKNTGIFWRNGSLSNFSLASDGIHYHSSNNLLILAIPSLKMIQSLLDAGFLISKSELYIIDASVDYIDSCEKELHKKISNLIHSHLNMIKVIKVVRDKNEANKTEAKECEMEAKDSNPDHALKKLLPSAGGPLSTEYLERIKNLLTQHVTELEPSTLAMTLNCMFDLDMYLQVKDEKHHFNHAKEMMCILDDAGYVYMKVLTNKDHLPLRHVLTNKFLPALSMNDPLAENLQILSQSQTTQRKSAMQLLLQFAPFTQLACLKEDKKALNKIKKQLGKENKDFLEKELDKPRADCVDYAFYIDERSEKEENPKDREKRCSSFMTIITKLGEAQTDLASLQKALKDEIRNSTNVVIKGNAANILEGIRRSVEEDAAAQVPFENFKIKGFFEENKGYILNIKEKIATMLSSTVAHPK